MNILIRTISASEIAARILYIRMLEVSIRSLRSMSRYLLICREIGTLKVFTL